MNKKILITGAGRGLGYELAKIFHIKNYDIYAVVRKESHSEMLQRTFKNACYPIIANLNNDNCIEIIRNYLGKNTKYIDIVINNAGMPGKEHQIQNVTTAEVYNLFNIHCLAVIRVVKATYDYLVESEDPKIVNISSRLGSLSKMASGEFINRQFSYSYRIAKAAQNMLSICLHEELKDSGIKVFALHPGKLKTKSGSIEADTDASDSAKNIYDWIEKIDNNIDNEIKLIYPNKEIFEW
ncbi:MAG: SDR family NAD(P)-dependent oxidoreductase [bacterium]